MKARMKDESVTRTRLEPSKDYKSLFSQIPMKNDQKWYSDIFDMI